MTRRIYFKNTSKHSFTLIITYIASRIYKTNMSKYLFIRMITHRVIATSGCKRKNKSILTVVFPHQLHLNTI